MRGTGDVTEVSPQVRPSGFPAWEWSSSSGDELGRWIGERWREWWGRGPRSWGRGTGRGREVELRGTYQVHRDGIETCRLDAAGKKVDCIRIGFPGGAGFVREGAKTTLRGLVKILVDARASLPRTVTRAPARAKPSAAQQLEGFYRLAELAARAQAKPAPARQPLVIPRAPVFTEYDPPNEGRPDRPPVYRDTELPGAVSQPVSAPSRAAEPSRTSSPSSVPGRALPGPVPQPRTTSPTVSPGRFPTPSSRPVTRPSSTPGRAPWLGTPIPMPSTTITRMAVPSFGLPGVPQRSPFQPGTQRATRMQSGVAPGLTPSQQTGVGFAPGTSSRRGECCACRDRTKEKRKRKRKRSECTRRVTRDTSTGQFTRR